MKRNNELNLRNDKNNKLQWYHILSVSRYSDYEMIEEAYKRKVTAQKLDFSKHPEKTMEYLEFLNNAFRKAEAYIEFKSKTDVEYVIKQGEFIANRIAKELEKTNIDVYEYLLKKAKRFGHASLEQYFATLYSRSTDKYNKREFIYKDINEAISEVERKRVIEGILRRIEGLGILGEIKVRLKELEAKTPTELVEGYYDAGMIGELNELIESIYDSMIDENKIKTDIENFIECIKQEGEEFYRELLRETIRNYCDTGVYKTHKEFLRDLHREGILEDFGIWLTGHPVNYRTPEDEKVVQFKFNSSKGKGKRNTY